MEQGAAATSPLIVTQDQDTIHGCSSGNHEDSNDSSASIMLVLSTFIAVCGSFTFGCTLAYSSPAKSGIESDLGLSAEYGVFGSLLTVGGMVGALMSGKTSDLIGRRDNVALRNFLHCEMTCNSVCKECIVPRPREAVIGIWSWVYNTCGSCVHGRNSTQKSSGCIDDMSSGSAAGFVQIIGLFFIPESPRWLAKIGKEELESALRCLRANNANISQEAADIREYTETLEQISKGSIFDLFQRRYAHALIVGVGLMMLHQFQGPSALAYYMSEILELVDFSTSIGSKGIAIIQIPATILGVLLTDRSGRRVLLLISAAGMGLSCFLIGLSFVLQDFDLCMEATPILVFIGLVSFSTFYVVGMGGLPFVIMSEIFPINVKGSAGSIVTWVNWFCSWIVTYTFNYIFDWSSAGVFFIFSAFGGLSIIFMVKLVPETELLRSLEEIQASMDHFLWMLLP